MKKRKTKKKRSYATILHGKVWDIFSEYIRLRDKYTCFTCGKVEKPGQAGHRYHGKLDFDPINVNCQCVHCNHFLSGNLGEYERRLVEKYGADVIQDLYLRSNQNQKLETIELERLLEYWTNELKKIK